MDIEIDEGQLLQLERGKPGEEWLSNASVPPKTMMLDLLNGRCACYMLSGYRGAGKTTYIRVVEDLVKGRKDNKTVFVHVDFSRYKEKGNLFRWLIRELHLSTSEMPGYDNLKAAEADRPEKKQPIRLLEELHEKSFAETTNSESNLTEVARTTEVGINLIRLITILCSGISTLFLILNSIFDWISIPHALIMCYFLAAVSAAISSIVTWQRNSRRTSTKQADHTRKTFFDDEVADHYFLTLLRLFSDDDFNIIFVLDEIDKVEEDRRETLLTEIKPYMLAGHASFIAVAGQPLYYKYRQSQIEDDGVLFSIFTKCIHIDLLSRQGFHTLFWRLLVNADPLNESERHLQAQFVDSLIFKSKRLPRRFLQLIREKLHRTEGKNSVLHIPENAGQFGVYSILLDVIGSVEENEIAGETFEPAEKDYFVMQLHTFCMSILQNGDASFELEAFFKRSQKEVDVGIPPYLNFSNRMDAFMKRFAEILLNRLEKQELISKTAINGDAYRIGKKVPIEEQVVTQYADTLDYRRLFELRNIVNSVCLNLAFVIPSDLGKKSFTDLLRILQSHQALDLPFLRNIKVASVFNKLGDLTKDPIANGLIQKALEEYSIQPGELSLRLLEFYGKRKADQALHPFGYRHVLDQIQEDDYSLSNPNCYFHDVRFEIKLRRGDPLSDRQSVMDILRLHAGRSERSFLFIILFVEGSGMQLETISLRFEEFFEETSLPDGLRERVQLIPVDVTDLGTLDSGFSGFISKYIRSSVRHVFVNQAPPSRHPGRNDDEWGELFDFRNYDLEFRVAPEAVDFWRFGLRFLPDSVHPHRDQGRHSDVRIGDISICAGKAERGEDGSRNWFKANILSFTLHNLRPMEGSAESSVIDYYDQGPIFISLRSNRDGSDVMVIVEREGSFIIERRFDLRKYQRCMVAAWCDEKAFKLVTDMEITRKVD